jgi:hypothetical protein
MSDTLESDTVTLSGEAQEVALAEAQAVRAMAQGDDMRAQLAELAAAVEDGAVAGTEAELLESVLELGMQSGRIRAVYGPGGEQAAVSTLRRLPRGRERGESAREVSNALQALAGKTLDGLTLAAVGPGAFTLTIDAGGVEASIRLDRSGARLTSVGT